MHKCYTESAIAGLLLKRALVRYSWTQFFLQIPSVPRLRIQSLGTVGVSGLSQRRASSALCDLCMANGEVRIVVLRGVALT